MFWSCTKLVDFWSEIFNTICVACSLDIDAHPLTALFGVTRGEKQCLKWDTVAFCNLIARRLILLCILLTTGGFFSPFFFVYFEHAHKNKSNKNQNNYSE